MIARAARTSWLLGAVFWAACGTQGDASVLPDEWPRSGLSGYVFFNADDPTLLSQAGADLDEPAAMPDAAGAGALTVFGRLSPSTTPAQSQIFAASVPALDAPGDPQPVLMPTLPWEGSGLRGPSVADPSVPLLFYQGEDGSVGVAEIAGDTIKKVELAAPLASAAVLGGGRHVGRAACGLSRGSSGDRFRLYYTVDDREIYVAETDAAPVLSVGLSQQNLPIDWQVRPIGLSAASFSVPPGDSKAVPGEQISELSARYTVTPVGRGRWDLSLIASGGGKQAAVVAGAYAEDSSAAEIYFAGKTPLIATMDGTLVSPTLTTFMQQPLLLIGLRQVRTAIASAVLP